MFVCGKTEAEIEAEQADMVRSGGASPRDMFQVFTWMEPTRYAVTTACAHDTEGQPLT